jgi:hypothetical protein
VQFDVEQEAQETFPEEDTPVKINVYSFVAFTSG